MSEILKIQIGDEVRDMTEQEIAEWQAREPGESANIPTPIIAEPEPTPEEETIEE